jgi:hypothetical protein
MPSVSHNILQMGNTVVRLANTSGAASGAFTEFSDAVSSSAVTTAFDTIVWKPVSGVNQTQVGPITWSCTLTLGQDLKTGSLTDFLLLNHGIVGSLEFYPKGGTLPLVKGNVTIVAPSQIGGAVGEVGTATVTLGFVGKPTITREP